MKKSKLKPNEIKAILIVLGVLAAVLSHVVVRQPLEEAMVALQVQIDTQTAEKARLKEVEARKDIMLLENEESRIIVENEMLKYPEDVLTEAFVMYADDMVNNLGVTLDAVNISEPALLSTMDIMRYINEEDKSMKVASYLTTLGFGWQFNYAQLKSFIEYVHSAQHRTVVNSVNIAYDAATGQLIGNAIINKYFIATPNYIFAPPDIPLGPTGNNNPFGTLASGQAVPER